MGSQRYFMMAWFHLFPLRTGKVHDKDLLLYRLDSEWQYKIFEESLNIRRLEFA